MTDVVDALPAALHRAQRALLRALDMLGLVDPTGGQPAWPFPRRLAVETLAIDPALSRQVLWAAAACVALTALAVLAWRGRRLRPSMFAAMLAVVLATPWPTGPLLWTAAMPTSFHVAPVPFDTAEIDRGLRLYDAHCASCHGADGRGETPRAATLPVWPPRLTGGLLWKRPEGELYGRVMAGIHDRDGRPTMPGFEGPFRPRDTWAVIDAMKALASGDSVRTDGRWAWPVPAPDFTIVCEGRPQRLSDWRGRRVRIVTGGATPPRDDARFETVALAETGDGCVAPGDAARRVFAVLGGTADGGPAQYLVDRDGWLRAMIRAGRDDWNADDLLCRSGDAAPAASGGGLDALIRRMDADPVRLALGVPHAAPR